MTNLDQFRKRYLSAGTFARRALKEVEQLSRDDFYLRPNRDVKNLIEEVWPLALTARQLDVPGRRVYCKYMGKTDEDCDGEMTLSGEWVTSGFLKSRYNVEITSAQFEKEHYVREALARYGTTFFDPDIHRVGSRKRGDDQIVSSPVVQDGDQTVKQAIDWLIKAVTKKAERPRPYPQPCILVVSLWLDRPLSLTEWVAIISRFPRDSVKQRFDFAYVVHPDVNAVHFINLNE